MGDLLFVTGRGMVKRTAAAEYAVRKQKYAALSLKGGDTLQQVLTLQPDSAGAPGQMLLLISRGGLSICFPSDQVPATGRATGGVKGMQLELSDAVLWSGLVDGEGEMLVMSERGYAKRVLMADFDPQNRNGKGLKAFTFNKNGSNGAFVAAVCRVREPAELQIVQRTGTRTPLYSEDVLIEARASKGKMYVLALMDDVVTGIE